MNDMQPDRSGAYTTKRGAGRSKKTNFHFPGEGVWQPMTVQASSREEAEKQWKQRRVRR